MLHLDRATALLFLPANRGDRLEKAMKAPADGIILDLEDSIALDAKNDARRAIRDILPIIQAAGHGALVRLNCGPAMDDDIASLTECWPDALMIPKVETALDLSALHSKLTAAGAPTNMNIIALVETPAGVLNNAKIAAACPSSAALAFGGEDYATAMGINPSPDELSFAAHSVALAAKAHSLPAFGVVGSIAEVKDEDAFFGYCSRARKAGFTGALTIHPIQVEMANLAFRPSPSELEWARGVIEDASDLGGTAIKGRDGRMIDLPVLERAQNLLQRASD